MYQRRLLSTLSAFAVTAMLLASCSSENTVTTENKPVVNVQRPNVKVGESNWTRSTIKQDGQLSALGDIETQDLTALGGDPQTVVDALVGAGSSAPTITNVAFNGVAASAGVFTEGDAAIGFHAGIMLSSGNIASIIGPNNSDGATDNYGTAGDADLDNLVGGGTQDASILEFDFECERTDVVSFQFVFASEEYNEFVNTGFNDVFAMFVNGVNVALIPSTATAVAINNVNCGNPYTPPLSGSHCDLFINNDPSDGGGAIQTQADGLTTIFTAVAPINPGLNHFKIAIADRGDGALNSWVMIKGESFVCGLQEIAVNMDIKPGSCPNPINKKDKGNVPVAIMGSETFDVSTIDISTLALLGLSPTKSSISDVGGLYDGELVDCNSCSVTLPDGYPDLILHFDAQALFAAFGDVVHNECRVVTLTGETTDDTPIHGSDVFRILAK